MKLDSITRTQAALVLLAIICGAWLHYSAASRRHALLDKTAVEAERIAQLLHDDAVEREHQRLELALNSRAKSMAIDTTTAIDALAQELGSLEVEDRSLTSSTPVAEPFVQRVPVSVHFQGSFAAVCKLAERMDQMDASVRPRRLTIVRRTDTSSRTLDVAVALDVFALASEDER